MKPKAKSRLQDCGKHCHKQSVHHTRHVYSALRKLLDTAHHVQARATEFENAIQQLREKEQTEAITRILKALATSPAGDLTRGTPGSPGIDPQERIFGAVMESLVEAFGIQPIRRIGEVIPSQRGEPPTTVELDRPLDGMSCSAFEVVAGGWTRNGRVLMKPCVRPIANT
jgi:hypothetical protein